MEATTLESDITNELNKLVKLTRAMIKGNPAQMVELTSLDDDDICVDIATLLVDDDIFYFTDAKSEDPLDDYIEIRSHALPQMAISLPRPLFTRIKEQG